MVDKITDNKDIFCRYCFIELEFKLFSIIIFSVFNTNTTNLLVRLMKKYKVLDLFSGAGGMSLGFHLSGKFETVCAIDNWQPAIDTFRYNHPNLNKNMIICDSVEDVFSKVNNSYNNLIQNLRDEKIDVIIGGPPCQGMSLAGKRLSNDPRNQLFKTFVQAVNTLKPKAFVMENVPGLLSLNGGSINKAILSAFEEIHYNHFDKHLPMVLKAECYGVPQIRRRLFYVGFRSDQSPEFPHWPPPPTNNSYNLEKKFTTRDLFDFENENSNIKDPVTVFEAISDLPKLKSGEGSDEMNYTKVSDKLSDFQNLMRNWDQCPRVDKEPLVYNHEASNHTKKLIDLIAKASPGNSVDPKYTDSKMWKPDSPGYTVKALGAGGGSTNRRAFHYSSEQLRGSTVRENARIQSFPDWYKILGAKTHQMTQVGNAVPPLLAKAISISIARKFENE